MADVGAGHTKTVHGECGVVLARAPRWPALARIPRGDEGKIVQLRWLLIAPFGVAEHGKLVSCLSHWGLWNASSHIGTERSRASSQRVQIFVHYVNVVNTNKSAALIEYGDLCQQDVGSLHRAAIKFKGNSLFDQIYNSMQASFEGNSFDLNQKPYLAVLQFPH